MRLTARLLLFVTMVGLVATPLFSLETAMQDSSAATQAPASVTPAWMSDSIAKMQTALVAKYGEQQRLRIERGLRQVAQFWRAEDGNAASFEDFGSSNFAGDQATLDTMFNRYERLLEQLAGHMHEINREFRQ